MGSLFDELKKANLINEKDAKRIQHEKRVSNKKKGGARGEREEEAKRRAEFEKRKKEEAEENRRRAEQAKAQLTEKERFARLKNLVEGAVFKERWNGPRRFHFVARSREILALEVDPGIGRKLESGELAICELPDQKPEQFVLIKGQSVAKIRELDESLVRFYGPDFGPSARE
ncbi:MAG: DUF2058 family protein [Planctomycetota bacterium]